MLCPQTVLVNLLTSRGQWEASIRNLSQILIPPLAYSGNLDYSVLVFSAGEIRHDTSRGNIIPDQLIQTARKAPCILYNI